MRRSPRAKKNFLLGMELRMKVILERAREIDKEIHLYTIYRDKYRKAGKPTLWMSRVICVLKKKRMKRYNQYKHYEERKKRYLAGGWL